MTVDVLPRTGTWRICILRPSFGNRLEEMDVPIEERSPMLRHTNTETTEMFYARMKDPKAWLRVMASRKNRLITDHPSLEW